MKILYAIQGTGNGHLARATAIVPLLKEMGETDVLVSGRSGDLVLPFPVKYRFYGLSFIFGKKGGIDLLKTIYKFRIFTKKNHYTVYLPAYSNRQIEKVLSKFPEVKWEVFSKHSTSSYTSGNISFQPVSLENFNRSFITCRGILCIAGFETPSEAIFSTATEIKNILLSG